MLSVHTYIIYVWTFSPNFAVSFYQLWWKDFFVIFLFYYRSWKITSNISLNNMWMSLLPSTLKARAEARKATPAGTCGGHRRGEEMLDNPQSKQKGQELLKTWKEVRNQMAPLTTRFDPQKKGLLKELFQDSREVGTGRGLCCCKQVS